MQTADDKTAILAALANTLLAEGEAAARKPPVNAGVVAALEALRQLDSADLDPLAEAMKDATLVAPLRARASAMRNGDASLITLTGTGGERVLPLFTSEAVLRRAMRDRSVVGSPLTTERAFEAAIALGFDAVELDRGTSHARRLSIPEVRRMMRR
jgi:hypothetical protein